MAPAACRSQEVAPAARKWLLQAAPKKLQTELLQRRLVQMLTVSSELSSIFTLTEGPKISLEAFLGRKDIFALLMMGFGKTFIEGAACKILLTGLQEKQMSLCQELVAS